MFRLRVVCLCVVAFGCSPMPCTRQITAYYGRDVNPATGKRGIVFNPNLSLTGIPIKVPCGKCADCRLEYSRQWAMRCTHESKLYDENTFITLTYDDDHLPKVGPFPTLVKRDIQLFHKRLHNRLLKTRGYGIRYYYCGEYGETYGRPHYHSIIFNYGFPDRKFYKYNKRGEPLFRSEFLRELWPDGHNSCGAVTFESCAYVARYVMDKVDGDQFDDKYTWQDVATGELVSIQQEFVGMSRRPGIGKGWFDKFHAETYRDDSVIMNGREVRPPRFYDNLYEQVDSVRLKVLKRNRLRKSRVYSRNRSLRRDWTREVITLKKLRLNRRDYS